MKKICKKNKRKNSFKKIFKGFTLVELLAVIVILAIIMLIAIPAVLNTLETARKKSFGEYIDKVTSLSQKQFAEDNMLGNRTIKECVVYNIKTELGLSNTGDYKGWVLINPNRNDIYVTLFDNHYAVVGFHYSDSSLKIDDYIKNKTDDIIPKLTIEELCNISSCSTCTAEGTDIEGTEPESGSYVVSNTWMYLGREVPSGVNVRSTSAEAMADWQDILRTPGAKRPVYLKLTLSDNVITEGNIGFILSPELAAAHSGVKAGTYTLKGLVDESSLTNKPTYEANKALLIDAFGASNCTENYYDFYCHVDNYSADVYNDGYISVSDDRNACVTNYDESAMYCHVIYY